MRFSNNLKKDFGYSEINYRLENPKSVFEENNTNIFSPANIIIIIINIAVFLYTDNSFKGGEIINNCSLSWYSVLKSNEYYRIITHMFLHADLDHVFNNMLMLLFIGSYLEHSVGTFNYLIIYFFSGMIAGCTSMVYNMFLNIHTGSIGASGAIFGVTGALLFTILIKHHHSHNLDLRKILFMSALSLYIGFKNQGTDNAAHIGGFISGFLITTLIYFIHSRRKAGKQK